MTVVLRLLLFTIDHVAAEYARWSDLPQCAVSAACTLLSRALLINHQQKCLTSAVNGSLSDCEPLSLACFCHNDHATDDYQFCLAYSAPCKSDPTYADAENFQGLLCNPLVDTGFRYTAVEGTETATLGHFSVSWSSSYRINWHR
jgi:hypothetical protein